MTTATAVDAERSRGGAPRKPRTFVQQLGSAMVTASLALGCGDADVWPSAKYQADPVAFSSDVLGIELWSAQVEIVEAIRDFRNVTVRSGHKCGKSTALAVAALWFYSSFERARVVMTAVKASQIDEVIWKEVRRLYRGAKRPLGPASDLHELARSGLRAASDDRQVWGITARDGEGLAGISGPNILILADEASGIKDVFFEVLGTSLAGSGGTVRKCYISNPTRTYGEFYRSHATNSQFRKIAISSEDTPNARGEREIPGLAGPVWLEERRVEYGIESSTYAIRVKGEFVHDHEGKIIPLSIIGAAEDRWEEMPDGGALQIGIDPAGDGVLGDETAMAVRRGNKIITILAWRGLKEADVAAHAIDLLRTHRKAHEPCLPRIAVDAEGGIGARVTGALQAYVDADPKAFELLRVRAGKPTWATKHEYLTVREALWGEAAEWIKAGGAIPTDVKLSQDLNAPSWRKQSDDEKEKRKVLISKDEIRAILGRSPDRGDALCLAVWGHGSVETVEPPRVTATVFSPEPEIIGRPSMDPYGALDAFSGRRR